MRAVITLRPVDLENTAEAAALRNMYIRLQLFDAQASGNSQIAFPLGKGAEYIAAMKVRNQTLQANANLSFIVANDTIVGFVCAGANTPRLGEGVGALNQIYLSSSWRCEGLGRTALRLTYDFYAERGCRQVILGMAKRNIPARKFYTVEGWTYEGRSVGVGYERWQKTLG